MPRSTQCRTACARSDEHCASCRVRVTTAGRQNLPIRVHYRRIRNPGNAALSSSIPASVTCVLVRLSLVRLVSPLRCSSPASVICVLRRSRCSSLVNPLMCCRPASVIYVRLRDSNFRPVSPLKCSRPASVICVLLRRIVSRPVRPPVILMQSNLKSSSGRPFLIVNLNGCPVGSGTPSGQNEYLPFTLSPSTVSLTKHSDQSAGKIFAVPEAVSQ